MLKWLDIGWYGFGMATQIPIILALVQTPTTAVQDTAPTRAR